MDIPRQVIGLRKIFLWLVFWTAIGAGRVHAQDTIVYSHLSERIIIGRQVEILRDGTDSLTPLQAVQSTGFRKSTQLVPNMGTDDATFWLKFTVLNQANTQHLLLNLENPVINEVELYSVENGQVYSLQTVNNRHKFGHRRYPYVNAVLYLPVPEDSTREFLLRIKSSDLIVLPLTVASDIGINELNTHNENIMGVYVGIILALLAYNLFIYFSVKDRTYIVYVFYLLFISLTQLTLLGYPFKYFWPNSPSFEHLSIILFPALGGTFAILFTKFFINTRYFVPKIDRLFIPVFVVYFLAFVFRLLHFDNLSYRMIDLNGMVGGTLVFLCGILIALKGFRPAKFFVFAWLIFILGLLLFSLKNLGILPYNYFTKYTMYFGTCAEAILLSFALADKINTYKKEKEISQAKALEVIREKEQFVREQNLILESKVKERTQRLEQTNLELNEAMQNLKVAESQLVHAEKMASLGQLTAGIAHEINNPINFVKSNIKPLKLDVADMMELIRRYQQIDEHNVAEKLKEIKAFHEEIDLETLNKEIASLLTGIEEGSSRTADIVRGLRTFSRVDEGELKKADIHEGINATLTLIGNIIPDNVTVVKDYGDVPMVECYPGKLNQVFMNILTNAVHAIAAKNSTDPQSIRISTSAADGQASIRIADTGVGIPEAIRTKIFDPFFTTKDVGEGTGLGLSMVFSIIQKHHGQIEVFSACEDHGQGSGAEFVITLPVKQPVNG
jgi:signal transduction histidine kinase